MMKMRPMASDSSGFSLLEVIVAVMVFAFAILALTSAGLVAGAQLRVSRTDVALAAAAHYQLERLTAQGYDNVTAGSATVEGFSMDWTIQGTNPKRVILQVYHRNSSGVVVPDTFVTYLADPSP